MATKLFARRFHPCCNFYLQGALRWTAIVNATLQVFSLTMLVYVLQRDFRPWQDSYYEDRFDYVVVLSVWTVWVSAIISSLLLDFLLLKAANQKNVILLKLFIGGTLVQTLVFQTTLWAYTIHFSIGLPNPRMAACVLHSVIRVYIVYVVFRFVDEIKEEAKIKSGFRDLEDFEVEEFYNGYVGGELSIPTDLNTEMAGRMHGMYRKEEFEISQSDLELDKRAFLGRGTYGTAYRALLRKLSSVEELVPVAVKTTSPESIDIEHFKALLWDLKEKTWIGNHKNIVNLIGACTHDIKKRRLYVILEFCAFGDLQAYLKSQRGTFVDLTEPVAYYHESHASVALNNDENDLTSTRDLVKWAKEIADGMHFLEFRGVIHGELAARNVLLTEKKVAKITDFGLYRQLYNYAAYMKTQASPIPWQWLAPEAILDMRFSTQSDVYSYGVTIWELFQLGEIAWLEYEFGLEFVNDLKRGKRMENPKYATQNICEIMLKCWSNEPEERPTFKTLSDMFLNIYLQLNDECPTT